MSSFFRSRKLRLSSSQDKKSQVSGDGLLNTSVSQFVFFLDNYNTIQRKTLFLCFPRLYIFITSLWLDTHF